MNKKNMLIALTEGVAPHTDALDCDDVRGPRSLFGESSRMPRPIGGWDMCCDCLVPKVPAMAVYEGCSVLWSDPDDAPLYERAGRIFAGERHLALPREEESCILSDPELDVPARTYLAGCATSSFVLAWRLLEDGMLPEWGAVLCSCQTEGRGRLRRPWHSPRGNLYVTFRLPAGELFRGDAASLVTGFILVRAFRRLGFPLTLKWPNDLLLDARGKAGGILLEERDGILLAGLGLNLVEAPDSASLRKDRATPAAVLLPNGRTANCDTSDEEPLAPFPLWRRLVSAAILEYSCVVEGRSFSELRAPVEELMAWKGRRVRLSDGDGDSLCGDFLGLGPGGGISLRLDGGMAQECFSGSLYLDP